MEATRLAQVLEYMRLDGEGAQVESLILAAEGYLGNAGIVERPTDAAQSALYFLAVKGLCLHWFDNRGAVSGDSTLAELPLGLRALMNQLKFRG